jgi:hypothetical protein
MRYDHLELLKNFVEHNDAPSEFQIWLRLGLQRCWQTGRSLDDCLGIPSPKILSLTRAIFILADGRDLDFKSAEISQDLAHAIRAFEARWRHEERDNLTPLFRAIHDAERAPGITAKHWETLQEKFFD